MKRSTKILGSTTGLLAAAAFAGLISGASSHAVGRDGRHFVEHGEDRGRGQGRRECPHNGRGDP